MFIQYLYNKEKESKYNFPLVICQAHSSKTSAAYLKPLITAPTDAGWFIIPVNC